MNESKQGPNILPSSIIEATLDVWRKVGSQHTIRVAGRSMLPLIQDGDSVRIVHDVSSVRQGDIVVFRYGGQLIAHRVMRVHNEPPVVMFMTKGDNTVSFDAPVRADQVIGRVSALQKGDRYIVLDTLAWRVAGRLVAIASLTMATPFNWTRVLLRHVFDEPPNWLTTAVRSSGRANRTLLFRLAYAVTKCHQER
ncbi:signal peptidase I [Chloroflexi bacterium TSY]|nr:signal peptidase I [Chloroflexi bacterium TSY]